MATKTEIIFSLSLWVIIVTTLFSLLGGVIGDDSLVQEQQQGSKILGINFNIITSIKIMPVWFNSIIFTSLGVLVTWLIVSSLPTVNGGS